MNYNITVREYYMSFHFFLLVYYRTGIFLDNYIKKDIIFLYGNIKVKMIIKSAQDIGKLVKEARKAQNFTQVQLAQLSNVGTRFLSDLENGKPTCEIDKVIKVLANLGIKLEVNNG